MWCVLDCVCVRVCTSVIIVCVFSPSLCLYLRVCLLRVVCMCVLVYCGVFCVCMCECFMGWRCARMIRVCIYVFVCEVS